MKDGLQIILNTISIINPISKVLLRNNQMLMTLEFENIQSNLNEQEILLVKLLKNFLI